MINRVILAHINKAAEQLSIPFKDEQGLEVRIPKTRYLSRYQTLLQNVKRLEKELDDEGPRKKGKSNNWAQVYAELEGAKKELSEVAAEYAADLHEHLGLSADDSQELTNQEYFQSVIENTNIFDLIEQIHTECSDRLDRAYHWFRNDDVRNHINKHMAEIFNTRNLNTASSLILLLEAQPFKNDSYDSINNKFYEALCDALMSDSSSEYDMIEFGLEVWDKYETYFSTYDDLDELILSSRRGRRGLPTAIEIYQNTTEVRHPRARAFTRKYIQEVLEDIDERDLDEDVVEDLRKLGFLEGGDLSAQRAEDYFGVSHLDKTHGYGDRLESITYLLQVIRKNNGKVSWSDFEPLVIQDKAAHEFFRKIFTNQRGHIVTEAYALKLKEAEQAKSTHEISHSTFSAKGPQNTTGTRQLVFLLEVPEEVKNEFRKDKYVAQFFSDVWENAQTFAIHPGSFGWVRVSIFTDEPRFKSAWLIDEIQSDFMYGQQLATYRNELVKMQKEKRDFSDANAMPNFKKRYWVGQANPIPAEEFPRISAVIDKFFGNWHKILLSSVLETARKNGVTDIYMGTPEFMSDKAGLTSDSHKTMKLYDKLPAYFHFTKVEVVLPVEDEYRNVTTWWHRKANRAGFSSSRVIEAYLKRTSTLEQEAALKHWMGALELAQALSGKPDIGQSYQALQEQKQRIKHEQLQTHKKPGEVKAPPPRNQKPEESQEYDIDEEEN